MANKEFVKLDQSEILAFLDAIYDRDSTPKDDISRLGSELRLRNDERTVPERLHACKYHDELTLHLEGVLTANIAKDEALSGLTNVKGLCVDSNELQELPSFLRNFTSLKYLSAECNKLTSLPEWIGELKNLEQIDLHNNELADFPESFGSLRNLKILNLSNNKLTLLPESFKYFNSLDNINLAGNKLKIFPECITGYAKLHDLDIEFEKPVEIPESLGNLTNLNLLRIKRLTSLPESIGKLQSLVTLDLYDSHVKSLPPTFALLESLGELYVRGRIVFIPDAVRKGLKSLEMMTMTTDLKIDAMDYYQHLNATPQFYRVI
jgi:internalin A